MNIIAAIVLSAVTWYPAPDWKDEPDPVASPYAKKGGTIRFFGAQAPKSLNGYVDNNHYTSMTFGLMYETLLATDVDTLDFVPSLAKCWSISDDGAEFTFILDERARWSDGEPVTAEDVKWTFDTVMDAKNDTGPWKMSLGGFESPEVIDAHTVRFRKKLGSSPDWRDLLHCGFFYILPKHAFADKDFNKLDLVDAPVGGSYRISRIAEQVETEFTRVENWWRRCLPSSLGVCNFDRLVMRYYIDAENGFEALKKRLIDVYPVYTARIMGGETHGEKFDRNWIVKRRVNNHNPVGFQGFAMNMRKPPFDDLRVRKAMAMLVDRETMNRTMMFGEYFLLKSYYTDLYDEEHPCMNPEFTYDVEGAQKLLAEAGWKKNAKGILEKDGREFRFTFLSRATSEDKFLSLFNHALQQCGIKMDIARKDFAGWMRDMDGFNFEMTWASWGGSTFRSPEITWLSAEADRKGSNNVTGFKSEEVDELIKAEKLMMKMSDRAEAYRRIDRLVAEQVPYVLLWNIAETRLLYWNKFGTPDTVLGKFSNEDCIFGYWWYDEDKAAELADAVSNHECLPSIPLRVDYDEVMGVK